MELNFLELQLIYRNIFGSQKFIWLTENLVYSIRTSATLQNFIYLINVNKRQKCKQKVNFQSRTCWNGSNDLFTNCSSKKHCLLIISCVQSGSLNPILNIAPLITLINYHLNVFLPFPSTTSSTP